MQSLESGRAQLRQTLRQAVHRQGALQTRALGRLFGGGVGGLLKNGENVDGGRDQRVGGCDCEERWRDESQTQREEFGDGQDVAEVALDRCLLLQPPVADKHDGGEELDEVVLAALLRDQRGDDGRFDLVVTRTRERNKEQAREEGRVGQEHGAVAQRQRSVVHDGGTVGEVIGQRGQLVLNEERALAEAQRQVLFNIDAQLLLLNLFLRRNLSHELHREVRRHTDGDPAVGPRKGLHQHAVELVRQTHADHVVELGVVRVVLLADQLVAVQQDQVVQHAVGLRRVVHARHHHGREVRATVDFVACEEGVEEVNSLLDDGGGYG